MSANDDLRDALTDAFYEGMSSNFATTFERRQEASDLASIAVNVMMHRLQTKLDEIIEGAGMTLSDAAAVRQFLMDQNPLEPVPDKGKPYDQTPTVPFRHNSSCSIKTDSK